MFALFGKGVGGVFVLVYVMTPKECFPQENILLKMELQLNNG